MSTILLAAVIVLLVAVLVHQTIVLQPKVAIELWPIEKCFQALEKTK